MEKNNNVLISATLKNLYKQGIFDNISELRENQNGYMYITLIKKVGQKSLSNNLYFSKATNELMKTNFKKGDKVATVLSSAEVVITESKQEGHEGERRYKISLPSSSSRYNSQADIEEAFGVREGQEFDVLEFSKTFESSQPAVASNSETATA